MSKTYTPEEVAKAVLKKCQELNEEHKLKKAEEIDKCGDMSKEKSPIDKCGDMNKEKSPMEKSSHLKNFMEKKKKKADLKKIGGGTQTTGAGGAPLPGSVATTGGPSIGSQIGWPGSGKSEMKKAKVDEGKSNAVKQKMRQMRGSKDFAHERVKGVHQEDHSRIGSEGGESVAGNRAYRGGDIYGKKGKTKAKEEHLRVRQEASKIKPNLPKSEDGMAANKAAGLKPLNAEKIKASPADQMPGKA
jgi:hypothetical protein